ncbi:MAG: cupin domain-containing protein [Halioglobus sp.]
MLNLKSTAGVANTEIPSSCQKKSSLLHPLLTCLCLSSLSVPAFSQDWVPVYEEPKHQLVFENDDVMILNVDLPPGYESLYHQHLLDVLYVTVSGTQVFAQPLNGEKRVADVKTGDLRFSSDNHDLPHIHRVGNIGTAPFHIIGVGVKGDISEKLEPVEGDMQGVQMVDEKPNARVYRISLKPGEKSGLHQHNLPFTRVYLSAGEVRDETGDAAVVKAGEFLWQKDSEGHRYENVGDEMIEIVEVQSR